MYLIVGLGNPGKSYANTRHNLGFRVLDLLTSSEAWENKYDSQFIKTDEVILAKPQLFMNNSGKATAQILKYYPAAELVVMHDELDLPLGAIRVQKNATSAGHKGVESIIQELNTQDFIRIRLGINNPETRGQMTGDDYVLQKFTPEEESLVKEILQKTIRAIEILQTEGFEMAQARFNG